MSSTERRDDRLVLPRLPVVALFLCSIAEMAHAPPPGFCRAVVEG
ncbi:hypothetical protein [Streptomyces sp. cg35]